MHVGRQEKEREQTMASRRRWYRERSKRFTTPRDEWEAKGLLTVEPALQDHNGKLKGLLERAEARAAATKAAKEARENGQ